MDYRIEEMNEFRVVGLQIHTTVEKNEGPKKIGKLWRKLMMSGKHKSLLSLMNQKPYGLIGVSVYNVDKDDAKKFDYYIACSSDKEVPTGMEEYTVPATMWAVFPCKGKDVNKVEVAIVREWQGASPYELLNQGYESGEMISFAPDLVVYDDNGMAEVWIAVKEK